MLTVRHEVLVDLVRRRPRLAARLLVLTPGGAVPEHDAARLADANLSEIAPAPHFADLVVQLLRRGKPVLSIVFEAQLRVDADKRRSWPLYGAVAHARDRCPACVLVLTPSQAVARWAAEPIRLGPGSVFTPQVMGPAQTPRITDPRRARRHLELAVLSAVAHGRGRDGKDVGAAALTALAGRRHLDRSATTTYTEVVLRSLNAAARRALEEEMLTGYKIKSPILLKVLAEGEARGIAKGKAEGIAKGEAKGMASALVTLLEARGLRPTQRQRARLLRCTDLPTLRGWVRRAGRVESVRALLD